MSAMPNTSRFLASLMALVFVALLGGCASNDDLESDANAAERQIYSEAQKYLKSKNFDLAIKTLQRLESRYPFGKYAEQAQLEIIYAHYGAYQPEAAIEAADRQRAAAGGGMRGMEASEHLHRPIIRGAAAPCGRAAALPRAG